MDSQAADFKRAQATSPAEKSVWEAHLDLIAGLVIEECRSRIQTERAAGVDKGNTDGIL